MAKKVYKDIRERKQVYIDIYVSDLDAFIKQFTDIRDEWISDGYTKLEIDVDMDYEGGITDWIIIGTRKETDKERDKRLDAARKARETKARKKAERKAEQDAADLAEYERLKKKFG